MGNQHPINRIAMNIAKPLNPSPRAGGEGEQPQIEALDKFGDWLVQRNALAGLEIGILESNHGADIQLSYRIPYQVYPDAP